jgi:hypothetical protein
MKVSNWRRKLAASLVAGGLLSPSALSAANLDTNLVVDPSFENVDTAITCCYQNGATKLNSWADGTVTPFAYNYGLNFDDGEPPAGGGFYFFGAGGVDVTINPLNPPPVTGPGEVAQNIAVGTGPTGTQIASGQAAVVLSGSFTSYNGQSVRGSMQVDFLNAGGSSLGSTIITSDPPIPWHQERGAAFIPPGTVTLRASLFADNNNGYIDNVDVRVTDAANELIYLEVNTTTGLATIKNQTGDPFRIDAYEVKSAGGASLNATSWFNLQVQNLPGFPAGNGSGNGWEQFGGSNSGVIGESYLTGNSLVANSASIGLGNAFRVGMPQDLTFKYLVVSEQPLDADFNGSGFVDGADFLTWQRGLGTTTGATKAAGDADGDADVDGDDLAIWKSEFGDGVFSGPGTPVNGFVRYVSGPATAVPEASSIVLVGIGLATLIAGRRKTA